MRSAVDMKSTPMIAMTDIEFRYDGATARSLDGFSLEVAHGECVVITGGSGCGKTTVTRLINGLIPHFYQGSLTGSAVVDGKDVAALEPHDLTDRVGSVFQNPRTQFFNTDTESELVFAMENCGVPLSDMRRRYQETVSVLSLETLCARNIFALSGGEKQRIAFGSAYALLPPIFVLDEPSANLDAPAIDMLRTMLEKLKREGKTIVVAEHRLHYLEGIADRIVLMAEGRIEKVWQEEAFSALSEEAVNALGLRSYVKPTPPVFPVPAVPTEPALEVRGLTVSHGRERPILEDVFFSADQGEIIGIVGPNGQGKTTFARTLCGLHREKHGTVLFAGKPVKATRRSEHAYLLMQDPNYQLFCDSVDAEIALTTAKAPRDAETVESLLRLLNLDAYRDCHPLSLSGGQKQRLSIALAALSPAQVLIFDEPTSGLDYRNMVHVAHLLRFLAQQGKTVLVITHDGEFLAQACTRGFSLSAKQAVQQTEKECSYESKHYSYQR